MNKLSASFLAMMLMVVIGACTTQETVTPTPTTPPASTTTVPAASTETTSPTTQATSESKPAEATNATAVLADGNYTTKGSYRSPAQTEDVEFTFTIKDGAVEDVVLVKESSIPMSEKYQDMFMEGIKKEIIGKKLTEIGTFDRVNGSSLTSKGFNQAMAELKQKA